MKDKRVMVNAMKFRSSFFRKSAEQEIQNKMTEHLSRVQLVTRALTRAFKAWYDGKFTDLDREIGIMSAEENAADKLLADMWLELTKGALKPKLRADILTFIKRVDEVANNAKRAGINVQIMHEVKLPKHIFEEIMKSCELLNMAVDKLAEALSIYRKDIQRTIDLTTEISFLEHQMDGLYTRLKNHYFEYKDYAENFAGLIIFDHAMKDIELAANAAEDASDVLRSIVISEV